MLVLNEKEVKYCRLFNPDADFKNSYLGISYQGFLLTSIGSFTCEQYKLAIEICNQCLLESEQMFFLIKRKNEISLCCEVPGLSIIKEPTESSN